VDDNNKLIAYHVWEFDRFADLIVIVNFANKPGAVIYTIGWPLTRRVIVSLTGFDDDTRPIFGNYGGYTVYPASGSYDGMSYKVNINIAPYSVVVYDLY
jgi:hypothetical protein